MLTFSILTCALGFFVAGPPDSLVVCDSGDYVYTIEVGDGTLEGTVQTNRCDEGIVTGTWWRDERGLRYEFTVDLSAPYPPCCPGYDASGSWNHQAGSGSYTWWNFGGQFCRGQGLAFVWMCSDPARGVWVDRAEAAMPGQPGPARVPLE